MSKIRKKKSTIDCRCNKLIDELIFKTKKSIIDSIRWFENALCKFFIQFTKTSCFVIIFKKTSHFDDFLLNIRVFLRTIKILFLLVFFTSNWRFSLIIRVFLRAYLTILFNYSRISTNNFCKIWSNNR